MNLYKPKFSPTALKLTLRNIGYMIRLGLSSMISEMAISCIMITGNLIFIKYLHEEGVAAFSVACYCMPLAFMVANAIGQSVQPIISFNYAVKQTQRVRKATKLSLLIALGCGVLVSGFCIIFSETVIGLFLSAKDLAFPLATNGFPYFASSFLFMTLNITAISYFQSIENFQRAILYMSLREFIFIIPCFILLPLLFGNTGLWIAVPLSEMLTFLVIALSSVVFKRSKN